MDEDTLAQMNQIMRTMCRVIYSVDPQEQLLLDLDSTLPCYNGITGDLMMADLRKAAQ